MFPDTYEEFKAILAEQVQLTDLGESADPNFRGRRGDNKARTGDFRLHREWTTGGVTGGSCWGGVADQPVSGEEEPEDTFLEEILELLVPNLTYLQYRKLVKANLYDKYDAGYTDYYGNYTTREGRRLSIERLYNTLVEIVGE